MKKENFKELLTDLYTAYNPDFIKYIPDLVEKYHRMEFDAVQTIFIKYNHESHSHYDAKKTSNEYVLKLIQEYDEGNRSLKDFSIDMQIKMNQEAKILQEKENNKRDEDINHETQKNLSGIKEKLNETEKKIEDAQKELDKRLGDINKQLSETESSKKSSMYDNVELSIKSNYIDSELIFPNKEILASLGKGTRLIIKDKSGKMVGLIIEEVLYDCISHPLGIPIIEVIINKG